MADIEVVPNCELEWDKVRGVLYVHNKDTGATVVRICGLPALNKPNGVIGNFTELARGQIDITLISGQRGKYRVALPEFEGEIT